jgi:hypothetical protein
MGMGGRLDSQRDHATPTLGHRAVHEWALPRAALPHRRGPSDHLCGCDASGTHLCTTGGTEGARPSGLRGATWGREVLETSTLSEAMAERRRGCQPPTLSVIIASRTVPLQNSVDELSPSRAIKRLQPCAPPERLFNHRSMSRTRLVNRGPDRRTEGRSRCSFRTSSGGCLSTSIRTVKLPAIRRPVQSSHSSGAAPPRIQIVEQYLARSLRLAQKAAPVSASRSVHSAWANQRS